MWYCNLKVRNPRFPPSQVANDVYPYAQQLTDSIRRNTSCGTPLFFMTWGRKNGDASNCAAYPPICTYEGMQQRLRESYMEMAFTNQGRVSPVGWLGNECVKNILRLTYIRPTRAILVMREVISQRQYFIVRSFKSHASHLII